MKKLGMIFCIVWISFSFMSCKDKEPDDENQKYKVTVIDHFNYLEKNLQSEYEANEKITVYLKFLSGPSNGIRVDDINYNSYIDEAGDTVVTFNMPNHDVTIYTTRNGCIYEKECEDAHVWEEFDTRFICKNCGKVSNKDFEARNCFFSNDFGKNWKYSNDLLKEFDIWNVKKNEEITSGMIFFKAESYQELQDNLQKNNLTMLNGLNEAYFEENILLYYYKFEPNISKNYVYNVVIEGNALTLYVNRFEGQLTALSEWLEVITIKKEDVKNVEEYNIVLRTICEPIPHLIVDIKEEYIRDVYANGFTKEDLKGLDNVKDIRVFTWPIIVDIFFHEKISEERLSEIINTLEHLPTISSVGYTSNQKVRVSLNNQFIDDYLNGTLTLDKVIGDEISNSDAFTMEVLKFKPFGFVTIELEKKGKEQALLMIQQLKELNFPFLEEVNDYLPFDYPISAYLSNND